MPCGERLAVPLKTTSSICWLRSDLADISPRDQRMASEILDFPQPLGPTIAVIPGSNSTRVLSANDLKPTISRRFSLIPSVEYQLPLKYARNCARNSGCG